VDLYLVKFLDTSEKAVLSIYSYIIYIYIYKYNIIYINMIAIDFTLKFVIFII